MDESSKIIIDIGDGIIREKQGLVYKYVLELTQRLVIEEALRRTYGNQVKAAKILGINRNTMRAKVKKFNLEPNRWKI